MAATGDMVVGDPAMRALMREAQAAAASRATLLISGPSGAGKEVLAQAIHGWSDRADGPFIALNCAALPETMVEALLFGHERGAYTGAVGAGSGLVRAACGGTLFLDEIGELPLAVQAKLLRVLQERAVLPLGALRPVPVNIRIVAATNRDLADEVAAGHFREDLWWRLNVFPLSLPPLAARPGDIAPLAHALVARAALAEGRDAPAISDAAMALLLDHSWPGNVRELDNLLQRAAILSAGTTIQPQHLRFERVRQHAGNSDLGGALKSREADAIAAALAESAGRKAAAAARLGISERTLRYKMAAMAGRPRRMTPLVLQ